MRLTGSLCTRVTHGTSGAGTSKGASLDSGRSTSTGATLTGSMLPLLWCLAQMGVCAAAHLAGEIVTLTSSGGSILAMSTADLGLPVDVPSTALFTDRYELTMLQAALRSGAAHRHSVFEVFTRRLPEGRRYGVVAGTGR